jgi:predicted alpha/beta superfamily hydrolase
MKKSLFLLIVFFGMVCNSIGYSQNRKHQFELKAKSVEEGIYPIEVLLPDNYDSTKRYPIVYITDWWFHKQFDPKLYHRLNNAGVIDPIIIVGIGTLGDRNDWGLERRRDLTPTHVAEEDRLDSLKLGSRGITGGANNFLIFIKNKLIPVIEAQYFSDTLNRGFVGYSFGGLFGAYVLSSEPQLFQHYLLGSPSMNYDRYIMIERLKDTPPEKLKSVKSIFISVGEKEKGDDLKGFADLRDLIIKMDLPNLRLSSIVIEDEDHLSAITSTLAKGLRFLYGEK